MRALARRTASKQQDTLKSFTHGYKWAFYVSCYTAAVTQNKVHQRVMERFSLRSFSASCLSIFVRATVLFWYVLGGAASSRVSAFVGIFRCILGDLEWKCYKVGFAIKDVIKLCAPKKCSMLPREKTSRCTSTYMWHVSFGLLRESHLAAADILTVSRLSCMDRFLVTWTEDLHVFEVANY